MYKVLTVDSASELETELNALNVVQIPHVLQLRSGKLLAVVEVRDFEYPVKPARMPRAEWNEYQAWVAEQGAPSPVIPFDGTIPASANRAFVGQSDDSRDSAF